jgi:hypothetical protein
VGQYTISSAAPAGYNATTVQSTPLDVTAGSTSALECGAAWPRFGVRPPG